MTAISVAVTKDLPEENLLDSTRDGLSRVLSLTKSRGDDLSTDERESSLYKDIPEGEELAPSSGDNTVTIVDRDLRKWTWVTPVSETNRVMVLVKT